MIVSAMMLIGLCFNWNFMIPLILFPIDIYTTFIDIWLNYKELPQYKKDEEPAYDDIWFEGQATRWGIEFMDNEKE